MLATLKSLLACACSVGKMFLRVGSLGFIVVLNVRNVDCSIMVIFMTSEIEYNEMVRLFNKELKYAESFGDNSVEVIGGLKESFMELYG